MRSDENGPRKRPSRVDESPERIGGEGDTAVAEGVGNVEPVLTKNTISQVVDEMNEQKNLRQGTLSVESRECREYNTYLPQGARSEGISKMGYTVGKLGSFVPEKEIWVCSCSDETIIAGEEST